MGKYLIVNCKIITPFDVKENNVIEVTGSTITDIIKVNKEELDTLSLKYNKVYDLKGKIIVPGFIDIHNHGAMGVDFSYIGDSINDATEFFAGRGVTSILASPWSPPFENIINNIKRFKDIFSNGYKGTRIIGLNMEGPYMSPKYGAARDKVLKPVRAEYEEIYRQGLPFIKVMTVAPETTGAKELIKYLNSKGVVISIGHSEASREEIDFAVFNGAKLITHIFNAFAVPPAPIKGVKPLGIEEYLLTREDLMAEVMADKNGIHVNPVYIEILLKIKGKENIILISDSIQYAGHSEGEFDAADGRKYMIKEDLNWNALNGDLCGSVMTVDQSIRNFIKHTGTPLKDAVRMATFNPAKLLGIDNVKGSIKVGKNADFAVIDENLNVYITIIEGNIIYNNLK